MSDPSSRSALRLAWSNPAPSAGKGLLAAPRLDARALRGVLAANWSRFVMLAYPDDLDGCAADFDVTVQCVRNWIAGDVCRPLGHHVAYALWRWRDLALDLLVEGAVALPVAPARAGRVAA